MATPLSEKEKIACLRLARSENVGPMTFYRLLEWFGSAEKALEAIPAMARRGGRLEKLKLATHDAAEKEIEAAAKIGARLVARDEPDYPPLLACIEDAPPLITVMGPASIVARPMLGVVGARNASLIGRKTAEEFARRIGAAGYVIASGLARGIDTAAHAAALETGTVAVVAGGIDVVYPRENEALYRQITEKGMVVAESPFGTEPLARHFPRRNRIISGLSLGVLIVEAGAKSGSLITAHMAAEQGREVFVTPGSVMDPRSEGSNKLLEDGATMARTVAGVLEKLNQLKNRGRLDDPAGETWKGPPLSPPAEDGAATGVALRQKVIEALSATPAQMDELIRGVEGAAKDVAIVVMELELAGRIERHPGNKLSLI